MPYHAKYPWNYLYFRRRSRLFQQTGKQAKGEQRITLISPTHALPRIEPRRCRPPQKHNEPDVPNRSRHGSGRRASLNAVHGAIDGLHRIFQHDADDLRRKELHLPGLTRGKALTDFNPRV